MKNAFFENSIHFVLQAKGGIGKSLVSSWLSQYMQASGANVKNFDTDQENTTFAHYKSLSVECVPVMGSDRKIDVKKFDGLMEKLMMHDGAAVVDNGANTFSPLLSYLIESQLFGFFADSGKNVFIHTIVGGGDTLADTAKGFADIAANVPDNVKIVLWLNEHFGSTSFNGKSFVESKIIKDNTAKLAGVLVLPARNPDTFGDDIRRMNKSRLTFDEIKQSGDFSFVEKLRLDKVWKDFSGVLNSMLEA